MRRTYVSATPTYIRLISGKLFVRYDDGHCEEDTNFLQSFWGLQPQESMECTIASMETAIRNRYGDVKIAGNVGVYLRKISAEISVPEIHHEKGFTRRFKRDYDSWREEEVKQKHREEWLQALK